MRKLLLALIIISVSSISYAADTQLSNLTELATTPAASDELYINDGGTSKKIQYSNIMSGNAATSTALAADPANCASSGLAGGINVSGVAEGCVTPNAGTDITAPPVSRRRTNFLQ